MTSRSEQRRRDEHLPDIDWAQLPRGVTRGVFRAPSGDLALYKAGDPRNSRVVLLAGVTGSKEDFAFIIPELVDAGYYVESYDLAGQYESWAAGPENLIPPRPKYDWDLFIDDLVSFLIAGTAPAHVLGYSFAGLVVQQAAVQHPELFASITLLTSPPIAGNVFRSLKKFGPLTAIGSDRACAAVMRWGVWCNIMQVKPQRLAFVRYRFRFTRKQSHADVMGMMMRTPDLRAPLAATGIPVDVAVGEHDLWTLADYAEFADAVGARMNVYRTGHSPCEDAPYELTYDMLRLFERARDRELSRGDADPVT